jgi:anaerobic magnesium-protoporphyrin IX monomethyl ester cyclase
LGVIFAGDLVNALLVIPRYTKSTDDFYQFPLGFAYVGAAIIASSHRCFGANLNYHPEWMAHLRELVTRNDINVVFCGGISSFIGEIRCVIQFFRAEFPNILVVAGGGVVSSDPSISLDLTGADFGLIGEAESSSVELLDALEHRNSFFAEIKGLVFRDKNNKVLVTEDRPPVMDLTTISRPAYELFEIHRHIENQAHLDHHFFQTCPSNVKPKAIDMITSRSCPYSCTFCFHPVGKVYRERPLYDVEEELKELIQRYGVNMVSILDELFSLRRDRLLGFCEIIKPLNIRWMVQLHVSSVTDTILDKMRSAGCTYISYGIESMSQTVLYSMQKKTKVNKIQEALDSTRRAKIGIQGNLIFGDTAETIETANESLRWWAKNRHLQVYLSRLQVYPGSPDYIMCVRDGLIVDRLNYSLTLPIFLNVSCLNNTTLELLSFILNVAGKTLLIEPAKLVVIRDDHAQSLGLNLTCPECSAEGSYRAYKKHFSALRSGFKVFCSACFFRMDLQVSDGDALSGPILLPVDDSRDHALRGGGAGAFNKLTHLLSNSEQGEGESIIDISKPSVDPLDSTVREKLFELGTPLLANPKDPDLHLAYGLLLSCLGITGFAKLHLERSLECGLMDKNSALGLLKRIEESGELVFITNASCDEPPFRASRSLGLEYDRKKEDNFPSYKRSANRDSLDSRRQPIYFQKLK